ncbi:MAG: hypothetical protein DRO23_10880 [Thermoprotei archaeon]|nr:MAG: hypothetical protein DRO23_10880 [Thermoprotei archaeon]RLI66864.1 MAG: hypothetical protein DRO67_00380 [Candidatus Asgardarchaeum californiense]
MSFFDKQKKSKSKKFEKATEGMTKEEIREAELCLLKPEPIPPYDGEQPKHKSELSSRTALIVFKDKAQQDLIGEIFHIRTSINGTTYITDISLLENIAKMVKEDVYSIVDGKIVEIAPLESGECQSDYEFVPLSTEQEQSLKKKARKKYKKILNTNDAKAMKKFMSKHFPDIHETVPESEVEVLEEKVIRKRRKL